MSENIISIGEISDSSLIVGRVSTDDPSLSINNEGRFYINNTNSFVNERLTEITNSVHTTIPISDINDRWTTLEHRPFRYSNNIDSFTSLSEGDLVFLEMKIENMDGVMKVTQTFIDKKNYQEVTRTYSCNISATREYSFDSSYRNESNLTLRLDNISEITETRKDI